MTGPRKDSPAGRTNAGPGGDAAFLRTMGDRLRTLRARRGVTRRELSRLSCVSERYIAQLESGTGNVSILLLRRIAKALGLGVEELVGERPERTASSNPLRSSTTTLSSAPA